VHCLLSPSVVTYIERSRACNSIPHHRTSPCQPLIIPSSLNPPSHPGSLITAETIWPVLLRHAYMPRHVQSSLKWGQSCCSEPTLLQLRGLQCASRSFYTLLLLISRFSSTNARFVHITSNLVVAIVFARVDTAGLKHKMVQIAFVAREILLFRIAIYLMERAVSDIIICLELADSAWHVDYSDRRLRLIRAGDNGCQAMSTVMVATLAMVRVKFTPSTVHILHHHSAIYLFFT
jgi:hypothetical protein